MGGGILGGTLVCFLVGTIGKRRALLFSMLRGEQLSIFSSVELGDIELEFRNWPFLTSKLKTFFFKLNGESFICNESIVSVRCNSDERKLSNEDWVSSEEKRLRNVPLVELAVVKIDLSFSLADT